MRTERMQTLTGTTMVSSPPERVFSALVEPSEQLAWNSLYLEVNVSPPGAIATGTVMTGRFKGSGRARVEFQDVRPGEEFTHHSKMSIAPGWTVGEFWHTYEVEGEGTQTRITQTVRFLPTGIGVALSGLIMRSFRRRLPESFTELLTYLDNPE